MKLIIILCLLLSGCRPTIKEVKKKEEPLHLAVATDWHYFSSQLHDDGQRFQMMLANSDGKMIEFIEEISDAFIDQLIEDQVDALILSGDLTFNGEKMSHLDLSKKLRRLEEQGIDVYVIPGNHDLNSYYCFKYQGDGSERVDSVNVKEFKKIYKEFYQDVLSQDEKSLSYIAPLREDIWLLMLDTNTGKYNGFDESTWQWMEEQLKKAQEQQIQVISVTHQNALVQHDAFVRGYVIEEHQRLVELLNQYGVKVNFSGHLHVQHIASSDQMVDIANSSLAVSPNQYSDVWIDEHQLMHMKSKSVKVSEWAQNKGITDERLLHFEEASKTFFANTNSYKLTRDLEEMDLTQDQIQMIREFVSETNYSYFAGTTSQSVEYFKQMPGYEQWLALKETTRFDEYVKMLLEENEIENEISIQL